MNKMSAHLIAVGFLLAITVFTNTYAEDYKIGVVNAIRILEQSPQAEKMRKQIEKEFAPRDRELVASQKKLKQLEDRLTKDAAIMSEAERKKLERDIINQRRDLKRSQDEFREDLTFRRNEEIAKIQKEIVDAINAVAKTGAFDVVLSEGVIFASAKVDISQNVIDYLNKKNAK